MKTIRKTYDCAVKALDAQAGIYELMPSTESIDRDGDILLAVGAELDNFRRNPVVMYAHNYSDLPVAKALTIDPVPGQGLRATIQFPPPGASERADAVHALWRAGFLNAASVGFLPKKWADREKNEDEENPFRTPRIYTQWELLEFSIVPVPSNQDALRLAVKTFGEVVEQKRGRVLSAANEKRIRDAVGLLDEVLAALGEMSEGDDDKSKLQTTNSKGAIGPHTTPKADPDTTWDGPEVVAGLPNEAAVLRRVHAWFDEKGDPDAKQSYKFPHHLADGRVVLRGVNNAMARLPQASIPEEDRGGVERHLKRHQAQFEEEAVSRDVARAVAAERRLEAEARGDTTGTPVTDDERVLADALQLLVNVVKEAIQ